MVRQALNMAVNKKAILDSVFQGAGQVAKNPIPPTLWSYNDKVQDYPYDPVKAKALLAAGRLSERRRGRSSGTCRCTRPYNPDGKRMAELIQADWEKVGVKAKLVTYEWGEYREAQQDRRQHAMMFGWSGDNGDPDNFFVPLLGCSAVKGGGNVARWCHKDFEDLVQKAKGVDRSRPTAPRCTRRRRRSSRKRRRGSPSRTRCASTRSGPEVTGYMVDATAHILQQGGPAGK